MLIQESQEQCAGVGRSHKLGHSFPQSTKRDIPRCCASDPYHGENEELSRSYIRMTEKSRTSWQRKCVNHIIW